MTVRGIIRVRQMRFWGAHGVTPEERSGPQEIVMDVELVADCARAAISDDLADAVDYDGIYRICERHATQSSYALLEALAGACLRDIMADRRIDRATVRVRKPNLIEGASPEVEITHSRDARG